MRHLRAKKIRKYVVNFDVGLLTAIAQEWGKEANKMKPERLYRSGKKLWKEHHPSRLTWGKVQMDVAKLAKEIEERKQTEVKSTVSRSAVTVSERDGLDIPEQV
jgi:NADPH-dependent 7-cyano-7-deazaguanine reductase QueF-like protein